MYKRILVPIDGSDTARQGLKEAIALAASQKATLRLLHVASELPVVPEVVDSIDMEKFRQALHRHGEDLLAEAKALAQSAGLDVETQLRDSQGARVADAIVDEATKEACDLIVVGSHGRRGFNRALLGSDAEDVVRRSPVPVLVVRATRVQPT